MQLKVIAYARNGHTDKFGIPRQSRDESPILTRIVFEPEFAVREALRGIEGFSHLWLIWGFSEVDSWSPTVRPPRLGGNKRMGVFATRSPFRPNPLGLTSVKLIKVESGKGKEESAKSGRLELIVSGADLLNGTPIYDIKPYLSFSDSHPDAQNGFADETKDYQLSVEWNVGETSEMTTLKPRHNTDETPITPDCELDEKLRRDIEYILRQDPRPAYQDDPNRAYKMDYAGWRVTFVVKDNKVIVRTIEKI